MKNEIRIDKTNSFNSIFRYIYVVLFITAISLWISMGILVTRQNPNNIGLIESKVQEVIFDQEENQYLFKVDGYEYNFKISNSFDDIPNLCNDLTVGEVVEVSYYKSTAEYGEVIVVSIKGESGFNIDMKERFHNDSITVLIIAIISTLIATITLIMDIYITRKRYYKIYNFYEFSAKSYANQFICFEDIEYLDKIKKQRRSVIVFLIMIIMLIVGVAISGSIFPDYPHIVIPIVVVLMSLMIFYLLKSCGYRLYREKEVDLFVSKYIAYLTSVVNYKERYCFNKDEFSLIDCWYEEDDEEAVEEYGNDIIKFTYEDMKFYAYCYFEKKFHSAHIYICSDKEIDGYPFICVMTPKIYQDIKENNVNIEGLDYLLNNLKEEIIYNNKNKIKYKSYKGY